jgi:YidC/Oxa1 family membrane protein insertase
MISPPTPVLADYFAPVQWIVDLLHPVLLFFHDSVGVGWGTSIVLLTVVVRALLAPLTVKQFKSMQAMVRIAPQLKELQAKHKNDKTRQQQEVMKFYAEHKVNPFASCLPLIAQMPFFIGLFYLLQSDLKSDICGRAALAMKDKPCAEIPGAMTGNEDFLFIADLTVKATGWVLAVLIVMYITSQLLSSILTPSTGDRNQRMIMYGLPFVFVLFVINFPTGLIVYWITTNLWTVGQGYILRKRMGPMVAPAGETAIAGLPSANARGGGFMARMAQATHTAAEAKASEDGKPARNGDSAKSSRAKERTPAATAAKSGGAKSGSARSRGSKPSAPSGEAPPKPTRDAPPPKPPRKKKKRSGRRR